MQRSNSTLRSSRVALERFARVDASFRFFRCYPGDRFPEEERSRFPRSGSSVSQSSESVISSERPITDRD